MFLLFYKIYIFFPITLVNYLISTKIKYKIKYIKFNNKMSASDQS